MIKHAVLHMTEPPFAYGVDGDRLVVRIRAARNDVKRVTIFYKDRYPYISEFKLKEMIKKEETSLFEFYEVTLTEFENRFRYYFEIEDREGNIFYVNERGVNECLPTPREEYTFQFPYLCQADMFKDVKWAEEGIVYQIFPERFCNGDKSNDPLNVLPWGEKVSVDSMFGGDLRGIIEKLDYLKKLGVTIIYMTPIFKSSTNHKYNTADYYTIDPQFGDIETFKELVNECHKNGMKIVLDAVFNHSGDDFFAFKDVVENGEKSKYKDWYFIHSFPIDKDKVNYRTFGLKIANMPKLNTGNKEVMDYLLDVARYWIRDIGIDGWRLDVCDEVDHAFWREFRKAVKSCKEDAIIIGEIMHESSSFCKGDQLDGIMNYPFKTAVVDFFAKNNISASEFDSVLAASRASYMGGINRHMFNLVGSHDTPRFLTECNENLEKFKLAAIFKFTYLGIPYIYYGDEIGMVGATDPDCRRCMIWDSGKQNKELLELFKKIAAIRKNNSTLVYGEFKTLVKEDNVYGFAREDDENEIYVFLNNNNEEKSIILEEASGVYMNLMNDKTVDFNKPVTLKAMEGMILRKIK